MDDVFSCATPTPLWFLLYSTIILYDGYYWPYSFFCMQYILYSIFLLVELSDYVGTCIDTSICVYYFILVPMESESPRSSSPFEARITRYGVYSVFIESTVYLHVVLFMLLFIIVEQHSAIVVHFLIQL